MIKIILVAALLGFGAYLNVMAVTGKKNKGNLIIGSLLIAAGLYMAYGMDQYESNNAQQKEETSSSVQVANSEEDSDNSSSSESKLATEITNPLTKGTVVYGDGKFVYDALNDVNAQPISDKELTDMGGSQEITVKDLFNKYGTGIMVGLKKNGNSIDEVAYDYPSEDHKGSGKITFIVNKDGFVEDFNVHGLDYTPRDDDQDFTVLLDDSKARLFQ